MESKRNSGESQLGVQNAVSGLRNVLPIGSIILLVAGVGSADVGSAQTTPSRTLSASLGAEPTKALPAQVTPTSAKPAQKAVTTASAVITNTPEEKAEKLLQVQLSWSSRKSVSEGPFNEPKANEMTLGRYTYSGIVVQAIKTKDPLQLLNPAAPSQYGNGWDNLEWFRASSGGPKIRIFSISF